MNKRRVAERVAMRPAWHHLLFLHWEIEAEALQRHLPPGLEVDLFAGRAYVGLIAFTMTAIRPRGLPHLPPLRRWHEDFHEVNVRTYVRHPQFGPGVWFFSLDAASVAAVCAARLWYKLPYFYATMRLTARRKNGIVFDYASRRRWPQPLPGDCTISYAPRGTAAPAAPGTVEHFLVERYLLYSFAHGHLFTGRVRHKPYQIQPAEVFSLEENLIAAAGIVRPDAPPLACYARRAQVDMFGPQRLVEKL